MPNSNPSHHFSLPLYILLLFLHFPSTRSDPYPYPNPTSIFLLAGQSNMAGRGGVTTTPTAHGQSSPSWDHLIPPESRRNSAVLRLDAKLRWVVAAEPLHADIDTNHTCGIGPGLPFAHGLLNDLGVVGLVPCAVGGTGIEEWRRGGWLYRRMIRRAKVAVKKSGGGVLQGLIWYQGERDTMFKEGAEEYGERLERFFGDLRDDLDAPMLPIIQVAIASGEGPYIQIVRQAQLGIDLLNLITVDAMGLPLEPDNLHLTTSSQVILGQKLANAFLQFLPKQTPIHPSQVQTNTANILLQNLFSTWFVTFAITKLLLDRL